MIHKPATEAFEANCCTSGVGHAALRTVETLQRAAFGRPAYHAISALGLLLVLRVLSQCAVDAFSDSGGVRHPTLRTCNALRCASDWAKGTRSAREASSASDGPPASWAIET